MFSKQAKAVGAQSAMRGSRRQPEKMGAAATGANC
jgi:hypothetical protein